MRLAAQGGETHKTRTSGFLMRSSDLFRRAACAAALLAGCTALLAGCGSAAPPGVGNEDPPPPLPDGSDTFTCESSQAAPAPGRLLTKTQYDNVVSELLFDNSNPSRTFPPEARVGRFNDAASHIISGLLADEQAGAAKALAQRAVTERLDELVACNADAPPAECGHAFIQRFGTRAFRRPLTPAETALFVGLFDTTLTSSDFSTAIRQVISAVLQSPQFLYQLDTRAAAKNASGAVALGPYEIASRLSFFLYNSMPDEPLLAAAEEGALRTVSEVEAQARRMLADPKARQAVREFFSLWLGLGGLEQEARVVAAEQASPTAYGAAWKESVLRFVDHIYWEKDASIEELLTSDVVFINAQLAPLYGQEVAPEAGFVPVSLPNRHGLFTQPGLMALLAHPEESSPILRGVFVRSHLLCQPPPAPPPDVNTNLPPPDPELNATTRERFAQHTENPSCAGCHALIDPLGFTFEAYDQAGRFRDTQGGVAVDTTGKVVGITDQSLNGDLAGPAQLAEKLLLSTQFKDCVVKQWFRHAMSRPETAGDACTLAESTTQLNANGSLTDLLVALAVSDALRFRAPGDQDH